MHLTLLYPIALFYVTLLVLNAIFCSIKALILEVFGDLNLVSLCCGFFICLINIWLIFKSPVAKLPPILHRVYAMWSMDTACNAIIYQS